MIIEVIDPGTTSPGRVLLDTCDLRLPPAACKVPIGRGAPRPRIVSFVGKAWAIIPDAAVVEAQDANRRIGKGRQMSRRSLATLSFAAGYALGDSLAPRDMRYAILPNVWRLACFSGANSLSKAQMTERLRANLWPDELELITSDDDVDAFGIGVGFYRLGMPSRMHWPRPQKRKAGK